MITKTIFYINPNTLTIENISTHLCEASELRIDAISLTIMLNIYSHLRSYTHRIAKVKINRRSFDFTSDASLLFPEWERNGINIFCIGGMSAESEKFKKILKNRYPRLQIEVFDGYDKTNEDIIISKLKANSILVIGLGSPLQELLALRIAKLNVCDEIYTCGGFISQTAASGGVYYPKIIDTLNLRWLWRIIKEPHVLKRFISKYPAGLLQSYNFHTRFNHLVK